MENIEYLTTLDHGLFSATRFFKHFMGRCLGKTGMVQSFIKKAYKLHERKSLSLMENCPEGEFKTIEQDSDITPQVFRERYLYQSKPLLIKGIAKN